MNNISNTAFYCCGIRMEDAQSRQSLCRDEYAQVFMTGKGSEIYKKFRWFPWSNASNVVRCRIIDDFIRDALTTQPNKRIVLIGAGFDSRAFRINGGKWLELDKPEIIEYKNQRLPVDKCSNELERIPIDFDQESLREKLAPYSSNEPVIVVIEGVLMYLTPDKIQDTLNTLYTTFPGHNLICDIMTAKFFKRFSGLLYNRIKKLGAPFYFIQKNPEKLFKANGYVCTHRVSIPKRAGELGAIKLLGIKIPTILVKMHLGRLLYGYSVYMFEKSPHQSR